jgi:hypothetical protein
VLAQVLAPLICALECEPVASDLRIELGSAGAVPPVQVLQLPLGDCQADGESHEAFAGPLEAVR